MTAQDHAEQTMRIAGTVPVTVVTGDVNISDPVTVTGTTQETVPDPADIVGASRTATGTLVVIPAGRTFRGSLSLSASVPLAGTGSPTISVTGAGAVPTGTIYQIISSGLALSATATSGDLADVYIYGGSAGATVTFTQGASGSSSGQISGRLL